MTDSITLFDGGLTSFNSHHRGLLRWLDIWGTAEALREYLLHNEFDTVIAYGVLDGVVLALAKVKPVSIVLLASYVPEDDTISAVLALLVANITACYFLSTDTISEKLRDSGVCRAVDSFTETLQALLGN